MPSRGPSTPERSPAPLGDAALAASLAAGAGAVLRALRSAPLSDAALGRAGDRIANELLLAALAQHRPDDGVLSEETADDRRRLSNPRVWILDPLDGTREYQSGLEEFAVHVALWERGRLTAAAVALPARDELLCSQPNSAAPTAPAALGQEPPEERVAGRPSLRIAVSRSRAPELAHTLAGLLDAELVASGSAGYKTAEVISGRVDAYLHAGGQYEWDSAAPVAVALAHGLHASRIDGSPLHYNQPVPRVDDLLICRRHLAATMLGAINQASQA